jgi:hypothetical protein
MESQMTRKTAVFQYSNNDGTRTNNSGRRAQKIDWGLEPAEVVEVLMTTKQRQAVVDELNNDSITIDDIPYGTIKYRLMISQFNDGEQQLSYAIPLNPYIHCYPLKHEVVQINMAASPATLQSKGFVVPYYHNVINAWNIINSNELPFCSVNYNKAVSQYQADNGNLDNEAGVSKNIQDFNIDISDTLELNNNLYWLLPFEGDVIHSGRWGQHIRFTSTSVAASADAKSTVTYWPPASI